MLEVFLVFFRLGWTSFGGPVAHLGYFHNELVQRRKWVDEHAYADIVALCQFLPGPASSQVGMALGLSRAGVFGAIAAWLGFTLPSAILLVLFALGVSRFGDALGGAWLHGLKIAAVAVVAQAIWGMAKKLCPDKQRASIAIAATVVVSFFFSAWTQILILFVAGLFGWFFLKPAGVISAHPFKMPVNRRLAAVCLVLFFAVLFLLPFFAATSDSHGLKQFDAFYRSGSLVFGGGHVVLPLLQAEVVDKGWVSKEAFMAGYGAAQAVPGPLFSFAAYLGAASDQEPSGWLGAVICLCAIYLPSFLLVIGVMPFWEKFSHSEKLRNAMTGANAAVVGLLLAAFYNPVWTSAIFSARDFSVAVLGFLLLMFWRWPSWAVVLFCAIANQAAQLIAS